MNRVDLIGRLTADPELRYTNDGKPVCNFRIAVNRYSKNGKLTDYMNIVVFDERAETCKTYLEKGSQVGVEGAIRSGSYEKDGRKIYTTNIVANNVEFLGRAERVLPESEEPEDFKQIGEDVPF